ncbi:MAG: tetratricopeptide repeat protein [Bdellovibrionales bacterium]|nr:tetratricopeptide repeat protein [Bdellovibrionales bacterium]
MELPNFSRFSYELKKLSDHTYELMVPPLSDATLAEFKTWNDAFIKEIKVQTEGPDGNYLIYITLHQKNLENFVYLTDDPPRYIVDFYQRNSKEKERAEPQKTILLKKEKKLSLAKNKKRPTDANGYVHAPKWNRRPAGDERLSVSNGEELSRDKKEVKMGGAFDAADKNFDRFRIKPYEIKEEALIASRKNIYVHFPILKLPVSQIPELLAQLPEFIIRNKESKENKEARLLQTLYKKQIEKTDRTQDRMGAFLKVYEHFVSTYPQSEYEEIVKNMAAYMYYLRWKQLNEPRDYERSQTLYRKLVSQFPKSPMTDRIQLWIAYLELERGHGLATIQEFDQYLKAHPQSNQRDQVKKAMAEGYLLLNKYDEALNIYREMQQEALIPQNKLEAIYREGDVAFSKQDWEVSEKTYQQALQKHPQGIELYPNAYFNLGETQFWQQKYGLSLDSFIQFLTHFPDHEYGGYAMTRIGELLEALGADRSRVVGAFLESYYRYQNNPGAEVGRIRMLSQQMQSMKDKELKKALLEIKNIAENSPLPGISEFAVLMTADGYQRREDHDLALNELITYYQSHPTSNKLDLFRTRILKNIAQKMSLQIKKGQFIEALKTQSVNAKTWIHNVNRIDIPYLVGQAYEQVGVFSEAKNIYQRLYTQRKKIIAEDEKERKINELLPSLDSIKLRLAAVALQERDFPQTFKLLGELKTNALLNEKEESEKIRLLAEVYRVREQTPLAIQSLQEFMNREKEGQGSALENLLLLSQLYNQTKNYILAEKKSNELIDLIKKRSETNELNYAQALEVKAEALVGQGKFLAAVETYQELLEGFESIKPLDSVRFKVGDILFQRGDLAGAEKIWLKLDETKNPTLLHLAKERLENARWQIENKKYLKRIPAMSPKKLSI